MPEPGESEDVGDGEGRVLRPEVHVLDRSAMVPERNIVRPPPEHFTHELAVDEPFHLDRDVRRGEPDGILRAGTRVVVVATAEDRCRVVDGRGLTVDVRRSSLRAIDG
jgi:hypothetical protein